MSSLTAAFNPLLGVPPVGTGAQPLIVAPGGAPSLLGASANAFGASASTNVPLGLAALVVVSVGLLVVLHMSGIRTHFTIGNS